MRVTPQTIDRSYPFRLNMALERALGKPRMEKLMAAFHQTGAGLTCRFYDQPFFIGGRYGLKQSPIILGDLDNLSFYQVRSGWKVFNYLNNYLLIPLRKGKMVFICDNHTHAAFAWALMQSCGLLNGNAALVHIDEHSDMKRSPVFDRSERPFLYDTARRVWENLEIDEFIDFAVGNKGPSGPQIDIDQIYFVDPWLNGKGIDKPTLRGIVWCLPSTDISLECALPATRRLKQAGRSVICDIDLDFFNEHYRDSWHGNAFGLDYRSALQQVVSAARAADFVTIATSPDFFNYLDQRNETYNLLNHIISQLK